MEAYALGGAACNVVGSPLNRALQTWIKKNWGLQEFVDSFLNVVKETEINFEVECNRLLQFNVRRAKNMVKHQGEDKQMLMRIALKKMYTRVRAFARVAQTFIEKIASHYRLSKRDMERLQSSIYRMNSVICEVRSLVVDCIFECGGPSKDSTDLVQIKMVPFQLRGGIGAIAKGGGVTHLRRQGNAEQADSELAAFDDQLRTRRKEIGATVGDLFELLDDIEMNHDRLLELQTKEVRESLTLEYNNKVKKIHLDYQEQVRIMAKSIRELEEEAEISKSALPEVESIQRVASEAIKKAEKEYKEKFLAKELEREMEHKAKMAKHDGSLFQLMTFAIIVVLAVGIMEKIQLMTFAIVVVLAVGVMEKRSESPSTTNC